MKNKSDINKIMQTSISLLCGKQRHRNYDRVSSFG